MDFVLPFRLYFILTIIITLALAGLAPVMPWLTQKALDNYIAKGDMQGLLKITMIMSGVLLSQGILQYIYTTLTNRLGQEVIYSMRKSLFERLVRFSSSYFDKSPVGITITRLVSDMETIADIFSDGIILIVSDLLQVVVIIIIMFYIDFKLACVSLVTMPVLFIATRVFQKNIRVTFNDVRTQVARLNEFIQEHLTAMRIVQVFNREEQEMQKFEKINASHRDANIRSIWFYSLFFPVVEILSATSIGLIVWYGGGSAIKGLASFGILVAFIQYINQLFRPIRQLADKFNTLQMGMVSSERIFKLYDETHSEVNEGKHKAENIKGKIEFRNVWFAYKENEWILRDLSFVIPAGQSVAIVGHTGAGKTTIINLINRLYEIQKGCILIDDIDIREYDLQSLRKVIGIVLQDVFLFSDSIYANVALYDTSITEREVQHILEKTGKQSLEEVWPNLEVFFHGGVAFTPYREQYRQVIKSSKMHYVETYNASEGYFGTQNDPNDPAMLMMIDYGVFYEFIPLEDVGKENPRICCLEEVELNKNYAMVISTSAGLWRYMIGDTVKFTNNRPYKFVITGRTKHFINAFGEELIVDNAEKGLSKACAATGAQIVDYSAAPVFMDEHAKCRHQWLIEFAKKPDDLDKFAKILDDTLKEVNSDYEAKRQNDLALQPLEIIVARRNLFHDWLDNKGKLGGQHKIPRLSNTREYMEEMLKLNFKE